MQVVLAILSVGLLGLIIYFAVSPKSSRRLKLTAFVALGLIGLSLGVCGFFLIKGPGESTDPFPIPVFQETHQPAKSSNTTAIVIFFTVFVLVLALIVLLAVRDQQRKDKNVKNETEKAPVFSASEELDIGEPAYKEDDSFEIEIE